MPVYFSIAAAVIPMIFYLFLIWKFDKFDREPVPLVLKNFLWGAIGAVIFGFIGNLLFVYCASLFSPDKKYVDILETIIGAPVIEEMTKGLFLMVTFSNKKFDNITDGIVYGGAIGLGFGMTENFLYFLSYGKDADTWISIVVVRTLLSAVMHCCATASFGAFLGYSKFKPFWVKISLPPLGFVLGVVIHFTWNLSVSFGNTFIIGIVFMIIIITLLISAYIFSLKNEWAFIKHEIADEVKHGFIPETDYDFLLRPSRKTLKKLSNKDASEYKQTAVTLAFRKNQVKSACGGQKVFCQNEIGKLRNKINSILELQNGN